MLLTKCSSKTVFYKINFLVFKKSTVLTGYIKITKEKK